MTAKNKKKIKLKKPIWQRKGWHQISPENLHFEHHFHGEKCIQTTPEMQEMLYSSFNILQRGRIAT